MNSSKIQGAILEVPCGCSTREEPRPPSFVPPVAGSASVARRGQESEEHLNSAPPPSFP